MNKTFYAAMLGVAGIVVAPGVSAAHIPEIEVIGQGSYQDRDFEITPADIETGVSDANSLMSRVPGGANNFNGPLSGQLQYRGLFGPRVGASIDGAALQAGGPNWMDSPLHYAPAGLVESFGFSRGITSIAGGMGIGGNARVILKGSEFSDATPSIGGSLNVAGHSVDSGYNASGVVSAANSAHRAHLRFARDDGDDAEFGDGTIKGTAYERDYYGVGYGFKWGRHNFSIDYTHVDTGETGNPTLPLDLKFFNTDIVNAAIGSRIGEVEFKLRVFYSDIDHQMDNFSQRQTPDFSSLPLPPFVGVDRRSVDATAETLGFNFSAEYEALGGTVTTGVDLRFDEHDATVRDPDVPMFFVDNISGAENDVLSVFAEWRGHVNERLTLELGARYIRTELESDKVDAQPAQFADLNPGLCMPGAMPVPPPCAVRALRNRFNSADLNRTENEYEWLLRFDYRLTSQLNAELAFARKTRAPSYIERFLWIPLEVNAGLGDGNNYVGRLDLDPEVAHKIEFGLDWRSADYYLAPRVFYHRLDEFIQGEAIAMTPASMPVIGVSRNANGDATPLQFTNVDAEMYGFDVLAGVQLPAAFRLDSRFSYVRGKRRDIDDNLFRIAPPTLSLTFAYERPNWFMQLETLMLARQDHISQVLTNDPANPNNSNAETPGAILLNLRGQYRLNERIRANFGIDNLLDKSYRNHLAGFNRSLGSDVPQGQRLPGYGINGYLSLSYQW